MRELHTNAIHTGSELNRHIFYEEFKANKQDARRSFHSFRFPCILALFSSNELGAVLPKYSSHFLPLLVILLLPVFAVSFPIFCLILKNAKRLAVGGSSICREEANQRTIDEIQIPYDQ